MRIPADENFPLPALRVLRTAGWDVYSIAEERPGISDDEVAALCAEQQRILLTFDKDFGELIFRRGLPAGAGVVLFRIAPDSPEEAAEAALALVESQPDIRGSFCVVTRDRIRVRPLSPGSGD
jgi:predicted nuclease of predicted toxin-antitoxin system